MRAPQAPKVDQEVAPHAPKPEPGQAVMRRGRNPEVEATLGASIRAARIAARMSQNALGEALGVSYQQVQKYELGKDRIAASTLQGIAAALGVHPGSFFGDEMPVPVGRIADIKATMRAAEILQQIRSPRVLQQLLALARELAKGDEAAVEQPTRVTNKAP